MQRHPFDPISAALGVLAILAGLLVTLGEAADLDTSGPWWLAAGAVVLGLAVIPWHRRADADADAGTATLDATAAGDASPAADGSPGDVRADDL